MKKVLSVLVILTIIVGSVFAAENDKLILDSTVDPVTPLIGLKTEDSAGAEKVGTESGVHVSTGKSIATTDIEWTFTVYQAGGVNSDDDAVDYARYKGTVTISLTPDKFYRYTGTTKETAYTSGAASVESAAAKTITDKKVTAALDDSSKKIVATYTGKVDGDDLELGTITCKWLKNTELPDGTYCADILIEVSYDD